jgi:N-acyl-D-aspartate/D-glutamate deacylase
LTGEDDANETTSRQLATVKTPSDADFAIALPDGGVLTRRAKIMKDDREAYERAHPEFFVNKLRDKGWDAKYTPMSVLNPDHPDFIGKKPPNPMKK